LDIHVVQYKTMDTLYNIII